MRRVAMKFVPKLLNCDQKQHRMNIANEMLDSVRDDPNLLQRVINGDEAWVYGYDVETKAQASQWKLPHEPRPKKARQVRSNVKVLLTVFFDCRGVVHHEFLPQGRTVNKEYYLQVMRNLREAIRQKRPDLWKNKNWLLHHDNAPAHTLLLVRDFLAKNNTLMMPQPPYSPDLAPCDFFLFPKLKRPMKGRRYAMLDEIKTASKEELKKFFKNDFLKCFEDWKNRWHKCIISHGDYFEGDKIVKGYMLLFQVVLFCVCVHLRSCIYGDGHPDVNFKLESEYIERCLGNLTPLQESCLVQLKKWMAEAHQGKVTHSQQDPPCVRGGTQESGAGYQVQRKASQVGKPAIYHGIDSPWRVCPCGLSSQLSSCSWTCLLELEGLNMRHLWRPGVKALLHIIEIVEANYPETMGRVLIARAPRVFPILWTLVSTFINETTRSKFLFLTATEALEEFVDHKFIPDFLEGPCPTNIPEGGLVPKSFYLTEEQLEKEGHSLFDDSMYHVVHLSKSEPHEVAVHISDPGSVICWDFDVMKGDVTFSLLRLHKPLPSDSALEESEVTVPRQWVTEQDYSVVEAPLLCRDGESVQGSHVTTATATYVLQWKLEHSHHHHHHKAKVMYYHEVLKSQDY
ncbi:SEC14L1, partial [Cordylochernes scorpioides]